jgi:hypothetical protein
MAGNEQMIIELDKKRMTAMAQKDTAALKNMLCKGLVYTHSSGRQDTKQSLMEGMESGTRCTRRSCRPTSRPRTLETRSS